jgi:endoribonuclease Dicer
MDTSAPLAARRGCFFALDALEGDPGFMSRTCDCRGTGKKKAKTNLLNIDEDEEMIVEGVLG